MASVDDPTKYREKFEKARQRLETADINENDREAIQSYIRQKEASGDHTFSTLTNYTTTLTRAAELAHKPLTEWNGRDPENGRYETDFNTFVHGLKSGDLPTVKDGGYPENYVRSFRSVLKPFFRFLNQDWSEDINVGQPSKGKITEADCFTSDEIDRLMNVANTRDRAIFALMLATGQRASAVISLRLGDVELEKNRGRFYLNPEAIGLKGAEGMRPMLWATPYMKEWVNRHPRSGEDDAPLFGCTRNGANYSIGDPLSYEGLRRMVKTRCDQAGIDGKKAQAHRFRHTAIRQMIRDGLAEQKIKYMVGWDEDSSQLARYGSLSDETHAQDIEEEYGIVEPDDSDGVGVRLENCPDCGTSLSALTDPAFCPECGLPLSHGAQETEREVQQDIGAETVHAENSDVEGYSPEEIQEMAEDDELLSQLIQARAERSE